MNWVQPASRKGFCSCSVVGKEQMISCARCCWTGIRSKASTGKRERTAALRMDGAFSYLDYSLCLMAALSLSCKDAGDSAKPPHQNPKANAATASPKKLHDLSSCDYLMGSGSVPSLTTEIPKALPIVLSCLRSQSFVRSIGIGSASISLRTVTAPMMPCWTKQTSTYEGTSPDSPIHCYYMYDLHALFCTVASLSS